MINPGENLRGIAGRSENQQSGTGEPQEFDYGKFAWILDRCLESGIVGIAGTYLKNNGYF
jgi:hypothetical protein